MTCSELLVFLVIVVRMEPNTKMSVIFISHLRPNTVRQTNFENCGYWRFLRWFSDFHCAKQTDIKHHEFFFG